MGPIPSSPKLASIISDILFFLLPDVLHAVRALFFLPLAVVKQIEVVVKVVVVVLVEVDELIVAKNSLAFLKIQTF